MRVCRNDSKPRLIVKPNWWDIKLVLRGTLNVMRGLCPSPLAVLRLSFDISPSNFLRGGIYGTCYSGFYLENVDIKICFQCTLSPNSYKRKLTLTRSIKNPMVFLRSWDNSAGRDGLDSRGIISGQGPEIFLYAAESRPVLGPTQPSIQWV
jgi:hypothetical protein